MPSEITNLAKNMLNSVEEIKYIDNQLNILKKISSKTEEQKQKINNMSNKRKYLLDLIDKNCLQVYKFVNTNSQKITPKLKVPKILPKPQIILPKKREIPNIVSNDKINVPEFNSTKFKLLNKNQKKEYIKELNIKPSELNNFIKLHKKKSESKKKITLKKEDYNIYKPNDLGVIANKFMKKYSDSLVTKYPKFFEPMFNHFKMVEMELLSRTYVSMMLFFTIISMPVIFLFFLALNFAFHLNLLLILLISFIGMIFTFFGFYFYPASLISGKTSKIKLELPFALVHMSAVAGSGAQPVSIFQLIADSDEYPELKKEIKKILNYVNLFGYNLTNALKNVSSTTPNPELKELLNGMISTIETGGDLRGYLKEKADEALNTYKLDRKKQVEALATYSEIYTALLIASPLLLLVTLAIINSIGGNIGGLSVSTIAWIGIIGALPLLNIGFMAFISFSQKGI